MNPGQPSRTAIVVAKSQALIGMSPGTRGLVDPAALRFVQRTLQVSGHGLFPAGLRHRWFRRLVGHYESMMVPGLALHHVLRKRAVEKFVRRQLQRGPSQVIQIGAGFDSLAFRLHREFPESRFLELDHPATQAVKRDVIESLGGAAANLKLLPVDLADSDEVFFPDASKSQLPSVVIAEGVLMYLDPGRVRQLLRRICGGLTSDSRFLFTFMDAPGFRDQSRAVTWWLRMAGEPFRWILLPEKLGGFLRETGLESCGLHSTRAVEGEWLCEARRRVPAAPRVAYRTRSAR